jgi:hypothetical protein
MAERDGAAERIDFLAIEPELTDHGQDCAAKASLSSIQSRSSWRSPACWSARGIAFTGPMPMISGGTPATL